MPVRLFVGNLPYDVTEEELKQFFASAGRVGQVFIPVDRETGKRRGFAFVEFEDRAAAEVAVRLGNNQMLRGRPVSVNEARPKESGGGSRPSHGGFTPGPRSVPMGPPPPTEPRSRNFGPPAKPSRKRQAARRPAEEERRKGPIRERRQSRLFGFDPDDSYDAGDEDLSSSLSDEEEPDQE